MALLGCSARASWSLLCQGAGALVYGFLQSTANQVLRPCLPRWGLAVAASTELWVENLPSCHTGEQRATQSRGLWLTACLGWLQRQPRGGGAPACRSCRASPALLFLSSSHCLTPGCSLRHLTHSSVHFLPTILKPSTGSEQTPRGGEEICSSMPLLGGFIQGLIFLLCFTSLHDFFPPL